MSSLKNIFVAINCLQKNQVLLTKELLNYYTIIEDLVTYDALPRIMDFTYKLSTTKQLQLIGRLSYLTRNFSIIEKFDTNYDELEAFDRRFLYKIILEMTENNFKFLRNVNGGALNGKLVKTLFRHGKINKTVPRKIKEIFMQALELIENNKNFEAKELLNSKLDSSVLEKFFGVSKIELSTDIKDFNTINNVYMVICTLENENFQILI